MNYPDKLFQGLSASTTGLLELSHLQGEEYLHQCARWLQAELGVLAVSIGEVEGNRFDQIRVLGFASRDGRVPPVGYSLSGTPCMTVIESGDTCCVVDNAMDVFPADGLFQEQQIKSYLGLPLRDGFGRAFGIVCIFDDQSMADAESALELLGWLADRIGNEAGAIRTRRNMMTAVQWMATSLSEEIFANCSAHLCEVLQVTSAFLMEWLDDEPGCARYLTLTHEGNPNHAIENMVEHLEATPFGELKNRDAVIVTDGLQERFPDYVLSRALNLQSCVGLAIKDHDGQVIGHLGIAHTRAIDPSLKSTPIFALYSARIAAELVRVRVERERREMERALSVKLKLESIGLMAGHIAHDFNNLLMAILGNANLAGELLEDGSPVRQFIENIEAASTSAGDVVSQLLDYAGRKPTQVEVLDVRDAVQNASRLVELSRHPSAEVTYALAGELPPVEVDPAQFQQIIINLVLNAAEALEGHPGTIGIRAEAVELTNRQIQRLLLGRDLHPGRYVEIAVTDDGVGIDDVTLGRMFDPFFSSKPDGRGLGLAAVRGFVQACGGGLGIVTAKGAGTTISLFLEPASRAGSGGEKTAEAHESSMPASVLVVDDELLVAETAAGMLRAMSYSVTVCGSCEEALAAARATEFDCALLDVRMVRIDGWTTLRRLRELQPGLPAVMMTGYANNVRATELVKKFDVDILYKPFAQSALVDAIREAISRDLGAVVS